MQLKKCYLCDVQKERRRKPASFLVLEYLSNAITAISITSFSLAAIFLRHYLRQIILTILTPIKTMTNNQIGAIKIVITRQLSLLPSVIKYWCRKGFVLAWYGFSNGPTSL